MRNKLLSLALIIALIFVSVPASAEGFSYIYDEQNYLHDADILQLRAQEIFDSFGLAVCYASDDTLEGMTGAEYSQQLYSENFGFENGILLLDCKEASAYYMHYAGAAKEIFAPGDGNILMSAYDEAATYDEAVLIYLQLAEQILSARTEGGTRDLVLLEDSAPQEEAMPAQTPQQPLLTLTDEPAAQPEITDNTVVQQPASVQGRQLPLVVDTAGVLDPAAARQLNEYADKISAAYGADTAVVFVNTTNGRDITAFTDDFYDYNGYGQGTSGSGIMFLVAVNDRSFAISTKGSAIETFTDYGQQYMDSKYLSYLRSGDWGGAANAYLQVCEELYQYEKSHGAAYDVTYEDDEGFDIGNVLVSLLGGFGLGAAPVAAMKKQMKTVEKKSDAAEYVRRGSFNLYRSNDRFITSNITRVPKPKDNSNKTGGSFGGGGSSIHISSSGSTHGGHSGRF